MAAEQPPPLPSPGDASAARLCRLDEIAGGGKEIPLSERRSLLLIRRDDAVFAYRNACPHTGAPLNWGRDQFLDWEGRLIQCSFHGALFRIEDGLCVWGPCVRQHLQRVPVSVRDGAVYLDHSSGGLP